MSYKDFLEKVFNDDETNHEFTLQEKIIYGMLYPLGLVAFMCCASYFES